MEKILVSACLLGMNTKYDGGNNRNETILKLLEHYDIVPFCPEVEGGLGTPREPSEIVSGSAYTKSGKNVTKAYNLGAEKALKLCRFHNITKAILKEGSPACGAHTIHDGNFKGKKINGQGFSAKLLSMSGIAVYSEEDDLSFLLPKEKEVANKGKYVATLRKEEEEPEEKPFERKPRFEKKEFRKDERPAKRSFGHAKPEGEHKSFRKDDARKPFHKDGERKSFHRDGDKKPFHKDGERKSFHHDAAKKPFHKEGEKKFSSRRPSGRKPFHKGQGK